jgi:thioredoxin reductase (NADPH)
VLLVVRGEGLTKSMSNYLSRRVEAKENIEILTHTGIRQMMGGKSLEASNSTSLRSNIIQFYGMS